MFVHFFVLFVILHKRNGQAFSRGKKESGSKIVAFLFLLNFLVFVLCRCQSRVTFGLPARVLPINLLKSQKRSICHPALSSKEHVCESVNVKRVCLCVHLLFLEIKTNVNQNSLSLSPSLPLCVCV